MTPVVHAQQAAKVFICKNTSSGAIVLRTRKCKSAEIKVSNISELRGSDGTDGTNGTNGINGTNGTNGTNGVDGADGSLRIYGDGSAGELHIAADTTLEVPNLQYTDILIDVGVRLSVPGGTILRCTGTFRNRGTLSVAAEGNGTYTDSNASGVLTIPSRNSPVAAHTARVASDGEFGASSTNLVGGLGGLSFNPNALRTILKPGVTGGGAGAGAGATSQGAEGGGALTVLAGGSFSNEGLIEANGTNASGGAGGGAGRIIIIASKTSISNTSTITAIGGSGGNSTSSSAAGGGGAGGLVHLLAPSISAGALTLTGGAAGSTAVPVTANPRSAGGGGGACGGDGGYGSDLNASPGNSQGGASAGTVGKSFTTVADPTGLF
jgi:hypothetical protein